MKTPIYLDYHATTPVDRRVVDAMMPYFTVMFGNAASKNHKFGRNAFHAVEESRETIGKALNANPQDICFTSGATESVNLAVKGVYYASRGKPSHYIAAQTEHKAVLDSFKWIENEGASVTYLPVDRLGLVDTALLADEMRPETVLVSIMAANNEIGVLQPCAEIGQLCRNNNVLFMTDATQALGKIPIDVQAMNIDLLACSAHKLYGPKGIGALYCRRSLPRVPIKPLIDGGGHERGLRSGTLNVPGIVGFGKAVEVSLQEMETEHGRLHQLRDSLLTNLRNDFPEVELNGHSERRLSGNLNLYLPGVVNEALMIALLDKVAISSGSACTTAAIEPSHVLRALGLSDERIRCSVRIGLGRMTTEHEVLYAANCIIREAFRIASLSQ